MEEEPQECGICQISYGFRENHKYFPMSVPCGNNHNVCKECSKAQIIQSTCPFCKQNIEGLNFSPNREFSLVVEANLLQRSILLLGDQGAGKSAIVNQILGRNYRARTPLRDIIEIQINEYLLSFWEFTSKNVSTESILDLEFKGRDAYIIIIDVTNKECIKSLEYYLFLIGINGDKNKPILVICNKADKKIKISSDQVEEICANKSIKHLFYSAKTDDVHIIIQILQQFVLSSSIYIIYI